MAAQVVPAQHKPSATLQIVPAPSQTGPVSVPVPSSVQTPRPGGPAHTPAQQSSGATHGAPRGAQALRQENPPFGSGKQRPPQHWASTWHRAPSGEQASP